jgi:hypothetical protein
MNPAKRLKVDSSFGGGERLHGEQEVEMELEQVADFLKVSRPLNSCVGDQDPHVFGLPDPDPFVRGTDPVPDPSLFSLMC